MKNLLIIVGCLGLMFGMPALHAWVLSYLWVWFITPAFGLLCPSLPILYGLTLVVRVLVPIPEMGKDKDGAERMVLQIAFMLLALIFGWLTHLLV